MNHNEMNTGRKLRILQVGLGPLGQKITQFILERPNMTIVAAVDLNSALSGIDVGVHGSRSPIGVKIVSSVAEAVRTSGADAAVLTTVSDLQRLTAQIEELVAFGLPVVSTCEELSHPWQTHPELAERIDRAAKKAGVAVLGTGVNPGFLMDALPLALAAVCQRVDSVTVRRFQNAAARRLPFQKKIGAGLSLAEFEQKRKEGTLRHVGLTESMQMIAWQLGWKLDSTRETLAPIVAEKRIVTDAMTIEAGSAAGVQQTGHGFCGTEEKITLIFRAAVGEPVSEDTIEIKGNPDITSTISGGVNGDVATCAITLNAIRAVLLSTPGLRTMADVPLVSWFQHYPDSFDKNS